MATLLLGMSSGNLVLPLVAIFAAASSLYVTDRYGWIYLNRHIANLAAVAAVLVSVHDFFQLQRERQLLAIAYLLIYLQIVLLFQRKTIRIYWQLLMLSLLQVVVASALNFGLRFGMLLSLYMFIALFAMFLFFIFREQTRHILSRITLPHRQESGGGKKDLAPASGLSHELQAGSPEEAGFRLGLVKGVLRQGSATLVLTFLAFLLLPRAGDSKSLLQEVGPRMVGFTETVRLGDLGTAIENLQPVMRVWLLDPLDGQPFRLFGEPLFRGSMVDRYENGTWSLAGSRESRNENYRLDLARSGMTRQRIVIEPLREPTLFAVYAAYAVDLSTPIAFNPKKQQLVRTSNPQARLTMELGTNGIRFHRQIQIEPVGRFDYVDRELLQPFGDLENQTAAQIRLEPLREMAADILREADLPEEDTTNRARALERFLKTDPDFQYSLTIANRDPEIDPIVDFLTENRHGHCEYFSSALTLMLRSQGIKARMVIGFMGGEWNTLGSYYQVRQKHAHSWTEAFIPPGQLTGMPHGGWLRLDPTPTGSSAGNAASTNALLRYYQQVRNYGEFLWSNYVIELDAKRQQEGIYAPLGDGVRWFGKLLATTFWQEEPGGSFSLPKDPRSWWKLVAKSLLLMLLMLLVFSGAVWIFRHSGLRRPRRIAKKSPRARRPLPVPFYKEFENILARYGMVRRTTQTPREFASTVADRFAGDATLKSLADLPPQIVATYYHVCHGGRMLGTDQLGQITGSLQRLADALKADA